MLDKVLRTKEGREGMEKIGTDVKYGKSGRGGGARAGVVDKGNKTYLS